MCTINDLRCKEVINVRDGQRLGFVDDVEFDPVSGTVTAIVVPGPAKILGLFGKEGNYVIPWSNIQKIGNDIVLINFDLPLPNRGGREGGFSSFVK